MRPTLYASLLSAFAILCLSSAPASAQTQASPLCRDGVYQGFSGGMMIHGGFLGGSTSAPKANKWRGATMGIGGAARVNLWQHLRVGAEGYISTMPSSLTNLSGTLARGSYISSSWGGVLADAYWRLPKVWPYVGATIGGGSLKSLYIYDGDQHDWTSEGEAMFNKQPCLMIDPFIGMDYCLTEKIHLSLRVDCLMPFHGSSLLQPIGPRLYAGFMFCH